MSNCVFESKPDGWGYRRPAEGTLLNIVYPRDGSTASLNELASAATSDILFIGDPRLKIEPAGGMFERMAYVIRDSGAGWVYSDSVGHPRIDYQRGSIRDNFDFGAVIGGEELGQLPGGGGGGGFIGGVENGFDGVHGVRLRGGACSW